MANQVLLDTNILVYSRDEASPHFQNVCKAIKGLAANGFTLCINRQVLREYASVVTRPAPKGLGAAIERALTDISEFETAYVVLPDPENVWSEWKRLVKAGGHTGLILHDVYIAAVMLGHDVSTILTLNIQDFKYIQGIKPVIPQDWQCIDSSKDQD